MTYRIFVSHTASDKLIAEEVTRLLNNAFEGDIELYLAFREIGGGDEWKNVLKENLHRCDAIVCIVTPEYVRKPWLFIEWSAFWLDDKKYYILLTDDIKLSELVHPMQDRQVTNMLDETSVRMFFRSLSNDSGHSAIPYTSVQPFVDAIGDAIYMRDKEKRDKSYSRFKGKPDELPDDDMEKKAIAEYFYEQGDISTYHAVVDEIRDDSLKSAMALQLVSRGNLENLIKLTENIISADKLSVIAIALIDLYHHDSKQLQQLVESIASKNQAELRKIAIHLANRGEEDSHIFEYVVEHMTNMAELRKVAAYFVENGRIEGNVLENLVEKIGTTNRAELRKVASGLIAGGYQGTTLFDSLFIILCGNQREAEKVMVELFDQDSKLFHNYLNKGYIVNEQSLKRLNQLTKK